MTLPTKKADIAKKTKAFIRENQWKYDYHGYFLMQRSDIMDIVYFAYQEGVDSAKKS